MDARRTVPLEGVQLVLAQTNVEGAEVLLQMRERRGSGDRHGHRRSLQQPGESDLTGCRGMRRRYAAKAASPSRERASGEWHPGQERQLVALADPEYGLRRPVGEVVAVLDGDDRGHSSSASQLLDADIADADVPDLAFGLQLGQGADGFFERDAWIGAMQLVKVDRLQPQTLQAGLAGLPQARGSTIRPPLVGPLSGTASLRCDHEPVRVRAQGFGDLAFVEPRAIGIGRVDQVYAEFERTPKDVLGGVLIPRRAPGSRAGEAHRSETEPPDW